MLPAAPTDVEAPLEQRTEPVPSAAPRLGVPLPEVPRPEALVEGAVGSVASRPPRSPDPPTPPKGAPLAAAA